MIDNFKLVRSKLDLKSKSEVISQIQARVDEFEKLEDEYSKFACEIAKDVIFSLSYVKTENHLLSFIGNLNNMALSQFDSEKVSIINQIGSSLLLIRI
jgi:hypothetical protein